MELLNRHSTMNPPRRNRSLSGGRYGGTLPRSSSVVNGARFWMAKTSALQYAHCAVDRWSPSLNSLISCAMPAGKSRLVHST